MRRYTDAELRTSRKLLFAGSIGAWLLYTLVAINSIYIKLGTQQSFYVGNEYVTKWMVMALFYTAIGAFITISLISPRSDK